jgi:hypothetical protein
MRVVAGENQLEPRPIDMRIELTSREPSGVIPAHLAQMSVSYPSPDVLDLILATNMISVGVDINRLGLMVVMGQPQAASEYIQATSRVGRRYPGLVVTLFNAARTRDRSHYESFAGFHSALYREVESTSVTPFSPRARDRALHAVLIALARLLLPEFHANDSARSILTNEAALAPVIERILIRVRRIDEAEADPTALELSRIVEAWKSRAQEEPNLVFANRNHPERALLIDVDQAVEVDGAFPTLRSLRDVDASSNLFQVSSGH